jgi:glycine cleavage system T protein (aminomethyltransferase)
VSSDSQLTASSKLKRTPLHGLHVELGARLSAFAGYEMPINFPSGILKEHLHTRAGAGLFDVSHMGQVAIRSRSEGGESAARALEALAPVDLLGLGEGRQRYALFTNSFGGVLDDFMITNRGDHFLLVVNASRKDADEAHLRSSLSNSCVIERLDDQALLALQGPLAESVLARLCPNVASMRFMDARTLPILGVDCIVFRSGYTGEDGFEISVPAREAESLARVFLEDPKVAPVGLGARDSLRLEAGLCLYGSDLDASTTPVEAGLEWAVQNSRRQGGSREGGFLGADVILQQLAEGSARRRVGLRSKDRTPVRGGCKLYPDEKSQAPIGQVTSGGFGPTINAPAAMGYVVTAESGPGNILFADVRDKRIPVVVSELPFVKPNYKRGESHRTEK